MPRIDQFIVWVVNREVNKRHILSVVVCTCDCACGCVYTSCSVHVAVG